MLNIPNKITKVPSTHTSPKRQLQPATLHYWPAGLHTNPMILFFTGPTTPAKTRALGRGLIRTILSYPILFCFTCPSTPAKIGALNRWLLHMILSYSSLYLPESPYKSWGSRQGLIRMIPCYISLKNYERPRTHPLSASCGQQPYTTGRPTYILIL